MFKKLTLTLTILAATSFAAPLLTLDPPTGAVEGAPGTTAGWGFTLTADPNLWLSAIGSFILNETNPSLGAYTDLIGSLGGPTNFSLAPGAGPWQEGFNFTNQLGLGFFEISNGATIGSTSSGTIRVLVEAYNDDPAVCGGNCVENTFELDVPFSVTVNEPAPEVPEPSTWMMLATALVLLARPWSRIPSMLGGRRASS
jgi:hypothetical protein